MAAGVDQRLGAVGIAAQDLGQGFAGDGHRLAVGIADQVAVVVIGKHLVRDGIADRTRARAFALRKNLISIGATLRGLQRKLQLCTTTSC